MLESELEWNKDDQRYEIVVRNHDTHKADAFYIDEGFDVDRRRTLELLVERMTQSANSLLGLQ